MLVFISKSCFLLAVLFTAAASAFSQTDASGSPMPGAGRESKEDQPKSFREMLTKQRIERERKDHEELLKRGNEAADLTLQIENAFDQNKGLSPREQQKLETLEKLVTKIRKELGGGDDESEDTGLTKERRPSSLQEAFSSLKETTLQLVDELKKSSRFTISAVAIRSSNTALKLVRFLRLRK